MAKSEKSKSPTMFKVGGSDGVVFKQSSCHRTITAAEKAFEKAKKSDIRFPYKKAGEGVDGIMLIEIPFDMGSRADFHSIVLDFDGKKGKIIKIKY